MQRQSPRVTVAKFTAAAVASIAIISIGTFVLAKGVARKEAVRNASDVTLATGANAIAPVLQEGIVTADPTAIAAVDKVVRDRVLRNDVVRVKLWARDGTILYSDETSLIGKKFTLEEEEQHAFDGIAVADVSNLNKPENQSERQFHKLLEVYDGIDTPNGTTILFEAYLRYNAVERNTSQLLTAIAPALVGGLLVLLVVQIPLALGLARKLEQGQAERETLLRRNIETSETERRRIAADLHDGVVQRLVGTSYSLSASAADADQQGNKPLAESLNETSSEIRQAVRELRTMIVTVAPPRLRNEGLHAAVFDLTAPLSRSGVEIVLSIDPPSLGDEDQALLYRMTQESIRNVTKHANAKRVEITIAASESGGVCTTVKDDGSGFNREEHELRQTEGHVGLHLLRELIVDAGGTLTVESQAGKGTTVIAQLPRR